MQLSSTVLLASTIMAGNITLARRAAAGCRPLIKGIVYDCGNPGDVLEIRHATMNPAPPQSGNPLEIRIQGILHEEVTFGSRVNINGKLEGVELADIQDDICQEAHQRKLPIRCPLKPPNFEFRYSVTVPFFVPSGHYEVAAIATNQNNNQIFNVIADFDL